MLYTDAAICQTGNTIKIAGKIARQITCPVAGQASREVSHEVESSFSGKVRIFSQILNSNANENTTEARRNHTSCDDVYTTSKTASSLRRCAS